MELVFGVLLLIFIGGPMSMFLVGLLLIAIGVGTFLWQVGMYLYLGRWFAPSGIDALEVVFRIWYKPVDYPWIFAPETWIGLHTLLSQNAASVSLIVSGFVLMLGALLVTGALSLAGSGKIRD